MMLKLTFNKGQGTSLKHEKERGSFRKTGFREPARDGKKVKLSGSVIGNLSLG